MKTIIVAILTCFLINIVKAQNKTARVYGYTHKGNQIIFAFNPEEYTVATEHTTGKIVLLKDISIHSIQVAGGFNNWALNDAAYKMSKTDSQIFTLTKTTQELRLHSTSVAEFKFLINNSLWVEPPSHALNTRSTGLINKSTNFTIVSK